jgi:nucleoside-diphosphate-sugar epimerase
MRIVVIGATGVIGRRLLPQLTAAGHEVTAVARSPAKASAVAGAGVTTVHADLFDRAALLRLMLGKDAVINLATHIPPNALAMLFPGAWRENDRLRRIASANLVDAALEGGVRRFVQESFALAYPDHGEQWIDESVALAPSRYNRSVIDAEHSALRFAASGGAGIILRFAAFYGPDATQLHDMIKLMHKGYAVLPGASDAFFSSVSHDDAAAAVLHSLLLPAGAYNVVDDEPLRRRDYFDSLAAVLGLKPPRLPPGWIAGIMGSLGETMARSLRISNRKLRNHSSWRPIYPSVREGWPAAVAALRQQEAA